MKIVNGTSYHDETHRAVIDKLENAHEMIKKCPICSFDPDHYKADGTCLCFDEGHQDKLKQERLERRAKTLAAIKRQGR